MFQGKWCSDMDVRWRITLAVWLVLVMKVSVLNPKVRFCNRYYPYLTPERTNVKAAGVFCISFQAFKTCVVRRTDFWVITPCRFSWFRCFGWKCCLRLHCILFSLRCVCVYNRHSSFPLPHQHQSERKLFALKMGKILSSRMFELSCARWCNNPVHYRLRQDYFACLCRSFE
jgi:hypothetical protein